MASGITRSGVWLVAALSCGGCAAGAHGAHGARAEGGGPASASASRSSSASRARAEAARAFDEGVTAFARGAYDDAARSFERAYRLRPAPVVLFNLARSYERAGQNERAADAYVAYLRADRHAPPERQRAAGEALARLR